VQFSWLPRKSRAAVFWSSLAYTNSCTFLTQDADSAIALDPNNMKALNRRGKKAEAPHAHFVFYPSCHVMNPHAWPSPLPSVLAGSIYLALSLSPASESVFLASLCSSRAVLTGQSAGRACCLEARPARGWRPGCIHGYSIPPQWPIVVQSIIQSALTAINRPFPNTFTAEQAHGQRTTTVKRRVPRTFT
jgi:hypothetical protein